MMSEQHIAYVLPTVAREGITKLTFSQLNKLCERGFNVYLVVLAAYQEEVAQELNLVLPSHKILVLNQKDPYLSVHALFNVWTIVFPVLKFLKKNKIKVVVAHAPYPHFVLRLVKVLSLLHSNKFSLWQYYHITQFTEFPLNSVKRSALNYLNKVLAHYCDDGHVSVSYAVKADIEANLMKHKVHEVIYNSLPQGALEETGEEQPCNQLSSFSKAAFTIVLPGRLEKIKGQLWLLDVVSVFVRKYKLSSGDFKLFLVGEGSLREELQHAISRYELNDHVTLAGVLPNAELLCFFRQCDLMLLPSFYEGLPIVVLEALQENALVLASDIAPIQEIIQHGETGLLFRVGDKEDCLRQLSFIYEHRHQSMVSFSAIKMMLTTRFSFKEHIRRLERVLQLGITDK